jgi:hypothetical protein
MATEACYEDGTGVGQLLKKYCFRDSITHFLGTPAGSQLADGFEPEAIKFARWANTLRQFGTQSFIGR